MDVDGYIIYIMFPSEWFRSLGLCVKNLMFNQAQKASRSQMGAQFVCEGLWAMLDGIGKG